MSLGRAPLLYRIGRYALLLSAPGLLAIGLLFGLGVLPGAPAVALCAAILLATAGLVTRPIADLARFRAAVERSADNPDAGLHPSSGRLAPPAADLWLAFGRLAQQSGERVRVAEARVAAADAVIAAVPDPLMLLDRARRIVRTNAPAAALDGAGDGPRDLAAVLRHPAVLAAADAVLRGEPARIVEFGEVLPLERQLRARFARIEGASPDGAVAVLSLHDVTELKRAEQMRADFIANASHELRTPLATLTGFIETLGGPAREDEDARERFLAIMQEQAGRMTRLVEDLLSLSRIELHEHLMPQAASPCRRCCAISPRRWSCAPASAACASCCASRRICPT